jgi:hypothetical protein
MLDLQAIIQAFGVEGRNRTESKQAVSPFWIVVTSQEKLDEIVTALDSKKIELARLQERFRITVDLKQSDISTVTSERVLKKKHAANDLLVKLFAEHEARIQQCAQLERTSRNLEINPTNFSALYPYLPYQVDLSIDIVAGLRLKRGAHRHVGGSNRTIIKQAQQMMINDRTRLAGRFRRRDSIQPLTDQFGRATKRPFGSPRSKRSDHYRNAVNHHPSGDRRAGRPTRAWRCGWKSRSPHSMNLPTTSGITSRMTP